MVGELESLLERYEDDGSNLTFADILAIEIKRLLVTLGFDETDVKARYFKTNRQKKPEEMDYSASTKSDITSVLWDGTIGLSAT